MPVPSEITQSHKRALLVEGDLATAHNFSPLLKQDGWSTAVVSDGFEAGLPLGQWQPSLLILDLKIPKLDGLKVLQLTRVNYTLAQLKIQLMWTQGVDELQTALDMEADDLLEKNMEKEPFMKAVRRWFGRGNEHRSV